MTRLLVLLLLLSLAVRAVSSPAAAQPVTAPAFTAAPCPFAVPGDWEEGETVTCGFVTVPEDRARPGGAQVRLAVAVFSAIDDQPSDAALIYLPGGPGGSGLDDLAAGLDPPLGRVLAGGQDFIVFDPRGTGYSQPVLACPELEDPDTTGVDPALLDRPGPMPPEVIALRARAARACRDRLVNEGINPAMYTSEAVAADVNDIRLALGYPALHLYGISYGTRQALTVLRLYPEMVRSVMLDAVVPPDIDGVSTVFASAQRGFDELFRACREDARCAAAYPDLETRFYALASRLNAEPLAVTVESEDGEEEEVPVTGDLLVQTLFQALYVTDLIPRLPAVIHLADQGFPRMLADLLEIFAPGDEASGVALGVYLSATCAEALPLTSPQAYAAARAAVQPAIAGGVAQDDIFAVCAAWEVPAAPAADLAAVSGDTPALLLSGRFDPITPAADAAVAARTLPNSIQIVFPTTGHAAISGRSCPLSLIAQFLRRPGGPLDQRCLGTMRLPWRIVEG